MLISAVAAVARWLIALLGATWRVEVVGRDHPSRLRRRRQPFVFALWHGDLVPLMWFHRGDSTSLVVSGHVDGGYLVKAARAWGYGIIQGSSTRGGQAAFRQMLRVLRDGGEIAITPDGPRGPARVVKSGVVAAAQLAGVSIIPVAVTVSSGWRLRSWDQFLIPKPFARVHIVYDDPLTLPASTRRADGARLLQQRLDSLTVAGGC